MTMLTVTAKGQVTLRKEILQHLGVAPGDKIEIALLPDNKASIRAERSQKSIADVFGLLKRTGEKPLPLEEIDRIIIEGWAGRR